MKGDREWFNYTQNKSTKAHDFAPALIISPEDASLEDPNKPLKIQGKKLSQIIAFIWANEDPETAEKLDQIFRDGKEKLKKLLFANAEEPSDEYNLLLKIFHPEDLPIFKSGAKEFIDFNIVFNQFQGKIDDPLPNSSITPITIPYPPSPTILDDTNATMAGYAPIKKSELKDWLNQSPNVKPFASKNPYIPSTSS